MVWHIKSKHAAVVEIIHYNKQWCWRSSVSDIVYTKQRDKYIKRTKYDTRLVVFCGFRIQNVCWINWRSLLYTFYTVDCIWKASKFWTLLKTSFSAVRLWNSMNMDSYNNITTNMKPKFFHVTTCSLFCGKERKVFWSLCSEVVFVKFRIFTNVSQRC